MDQKLLQAALPEQSTVTYYTHKRNPRNLPHFHTANYVNRNCTFPHEVWIIMLSTINTIFYETTYSLINCQMSKVTLYRLQGKRSRNDLVTIFFFFTLHGDQMVRLDSRTALLWSENNMTMFESLRPGESLIYIEKSWVTTVLVRFKWKD